VPVCRRPARPATAPHLRSDGHPERIDQPAEPLELRGEPTQLVVAQRAKLVGGSGAQLLRRPLDSLCRSCHMKSVAGTTDIPLVLVNATIYGE
jgi:hypothetical protein